MMNQKHIFILLFLFVCLSITQAQQVNLQWAKQIGSVNTDISKSIAVDAQGNVYTAGYFESTADFDPGSGVFELTSEGNSDIFISKLDAYGNFVWALRIGGPFNDYVFSIVSDNGAYLYLTGYFTGTVDFDPGSNTHLLTSVNYDNYILKLDTAGNFVWVKQIGGNFAEFSKSLAIDPHGNVYTTGAFTDTCDFDPGPSIYNMTTTSNFDIYISKLNSQGDFVWAKQLGGINNDYGQAVTVDNFDNVYTTGYFEGLADMDPGPSTINFTSAGTSDVFISKLDSNGNFVWAKQLGGSSQDVGNSIAVDLFGNVLTTGTFIGSADFDPSNSSFPLNSFGGADIFISKLNASGDFKWAKQLGGTSQDEGNTITVDAFGNVYSSGDFLATADFDPGAGVCAYISQGLADVYISKLDSSGNFVWAKQIGGTDDDRDYSVIVDGAGSIYTTGYFRGTVDFDPNAGTWPMTSFGNKDVFILKLNISNGIGLLDNDNRINVYPNPSSGIFNVDALNNEKASLEVFNMLGESVFFVRNQQTNDYKVDITGQPSGIYFLKLVSHSKSSCFKIIKQ